jgi:hypothetical protein
LVQKVDKATHAKGGMLDLFIMDKTLFKEETLVITDITFRTDHHPILMKMPSTNKTKNQDDVIIRHVRELYTFDITKFRDSLKSEDLSNPDFVSELDLSEAISLYNSTLARLLDDQCPIVTKRYRLKYWNSKWYNSSLKNLKRKKRGAERKFRKNPCVANENFLKHMRNKYNSELKRTREEFYHQKLTENIADSKELFKVVKKLTGNAKQKVQPVSKHKALVADEMAVYYTKKISDIRDSIEKERHQEGIERTISPCPDMNNFRGFEQIDYTELKATLSSMKSKTSRADPIATTVVKQNLELLAPVLLHIVNCCLTQNIFPKELKNACITPIIKDERKNPEDFQNFRPISNLEFLSKLLERVMYRQLTKHIEAFNLHTRFQSAYKPNHSCETAMVHIIDDIQRLRQEKLNVVLIMLDLSSAFDTVDHGLLLDRLQRQFGICDGALQLIESYLCQRTFSVVIDDYTSKKQDLQYGVPQGSILGPLFYLMYTSKLETIVEKHGLKVHLYADDCTIYFPFEKDVDAAEKKLFQCVHDIKNWARNSFLKLNRDKTLITLFRPNGSLNPRNIESFSLNDGGNKIKSIDRVKLLGVELGPSLNFSEFVNKKIQTCNYHLRNLRYVKESIPTNTRIRLVTSLICSNIDYCNALLLCSPKYVLDRLQKVLNKAVRFIFNVRKRDHISPYLYKLHILPVTYRVKFKVSVIAFKVMRGVAPAYLTNKVQKFEPTCNKYLRPGSGRDKWMFENNIAVQKSSTFISKMITVWNELPLTLRQFENFSTFKSKLKTHYFTLAFASM